jgi:nucleotide-binding universal stress UspA family protein
MPRKGDAMEHAPFKQILVPTDLSKYSEPAICLAISMARSMGSEITFIHVWPPEFTFAEDYKAQTDAEVRHLREDLHVERMRMLEEFVGRYELEGLKTSCILKSGPPFLEILIAASELKADLIVMGTHGRSGLASVLIGSVAEKVVRRAHCPVLTVKPEDFKFEEVCPNLRPGA